MKNDIDFDELDKAVNSLMGKAPAGKTDDDTPQQKTLSISSTLAPGERPAYDKLEEVAKKIGSETLVTDGERTVVEDLDSVDESVVKLTTVPSSTPPVAPAPTPVARPAVTVSPRGSGGRFMDVVHPSSAMRGKVSEKAPEVTASVTTAAPVVSSQNQPKPSETPEIAPLTPFLPDAKVEKRPLGEPAAPLGPVPSPFGESAASEQTPNDALDAVEEAPEEIIAINSEVAEQNNLSDAQAEIDATKITAKDTQAEELQVIEDSEVATTGSPDMSQAISVVESVDTELVARQSVDGTSGDATQKTGTIYDTQEYHQPLARPAKQKSGWGVVVIIVIIIILAAAAGAGAYFLLGLNA